MLYSEFCVKIPIAAVIFVGILRVVHSAEPQLCEAAYINVEEMVKISLLRHYTMEYAPLAHQSLAKIEGISAESGEEERIEKAIKTWTESVQTFEEGIRAFQGKRILVRPLVVNLVDALDEDRRVEGGDPSQSPLRAFHEQTAPTGESTDWEQLFRLLDASLRRNLSPYEAAYLVQEFTLRRNSRELMAGVLRLQRALNAFESREELSDALMADLLEPIAQLGHGLVIGAQHSTLLEAECSQHKVTWDKHLERFVPFWEVIRPIHDNIGLKNCLIPIQKGKSSTAKKFHLNLMSKLYPAKTKKQLRELEEMRQEFEELENKTKLEENEFKEEVNVQIRRTALSLFYAHFFQILHQIMLCRAFKMTNEKCFDKYMELEEYEHTAQMSPSGYAIYWLHTMREASKRRFEADKAQFLEAFERLKSEKVNWRDFDEESTMIQMCVKRWSEKADGHMKSVLQTLLFEFDFLQCKN